MASLSVDPSSSKAHYFMAQNDKERDSWIEAISRAKSVLEPLLSKHACVCVCVCCTC